MGDIADWMVDQALEQGVFHRTPGLCEHMWTTADGKTIRIRDMDSGHLLNVIRLLERRAEREIDTCMAMADIECGCADLFDDDVNFKHPIYDDMVAEAKRRGLDLTMPAFAANRIANTDEFPTCEPSKK